MFFDTSYTSGFYVTCSRCCWYSILIPLVFTITNLFHQIPNVSTHLLWLIEPTQPACMAGWKHHRIKNSWKSPLTNDRHVGAVICLCSLILQKTTLWIQILKLFPAFSSRIKLQLFKVINCLKIHLLHTPFIFFSLPLSWYFLENPPK